MTAAVLGTEAMSTGLAVSLTHRETYPVYVGQALEAALPVVLADARGARGSGRVHVITDSYADTLEVDQFPLVRLVRADESSYCLEFTKTHTYVLHGPGGVVTQGAC